MPTREKARARRRTVLRFALLVLLLLGLTLLALAARLAADGAWAGLSLVPLGLLFAGFPLAALRVLLRHRRIARRLGRVVADVRPPTVLTGGPLLAELVVRPAADVALGASAVLAGTGRPWLVVELQPATAMRAGVERRLQGTIVVPPDAEPTRPGPDDAVSWRVWFELEVDGDPLRIGDLHVDVVRAGADEVGP